MAAETAGGNAIRPRPAATSPFPFLRLPAETQQEIISHCSQSDLICVALVSKRFHELASAQLYRNFHIVFPDDDDINFDSPIDGLAGGLDTFTTSQYNYAQHLNDLSMDTLSAGIKGEHSYQSYLYSASCGKFLNTLLHLTLRKAKSLEAFRWNIRVELSRTVYRELHQIPSLKILHVRMQAGDSYYIPPPPLPVSADTLSQPPADAVWPSLSSTGIPLLPPVSQIAPHLALDPPFRSGARSRFGKRGHSSPREPATFSGFRNLRCLSVLDIDNLDIISELKTCIKNSYSTLKELRLSFSDALAQQARRPPPDSDADESDVDDDFHPGLPSHSTAAYHISSPAKAYRAQQERRLQEAALGKIFDIEKASRKKTANPQPDPSRTSPAAAASGSKAEAERIVSPSDFREEFISSIRDVSSKLMSILNGSEELSTVQQDILDTIVRAARKYVDSGAPSAAGSAETGSSQPSTVRFNSETPDARSCDTDSANELTSPRLPSSDRADQPRQTMHDKAGELPDGTGTLEKTPLPLTADGDGQHLAEDGADAQLAASMKHRRQQSSSSLGALLGPLVADSSPDVSNAKPSAAPPRTEAGHRHENGSKDESLRHCMGAYVRDTRGLPLKSLSLYLIPVKVSVLSQGVDLSCLQQLTLLNVGNQTPTWSMLAEEARSRPLALRKVFTDHVSTAFLSCMGHLPALEDLFMLERSIKHKPESFAPRSPTTMDQIRRMVLRKHMPRLKRLMIKDESSGPNWDANEKTMILICTRGARLEELALGMNIHAVHAFMQYFSGLVNLRAINILHFKNNDTCIWVMREILRFIVDNLSHHPELKLEWIAMEDERVDRVVRPSEKPDEVAGDAPAKRSQSKGKGKEKAHVSTGDSWDDAYPLLPLDALDSESDSDEDGTDNGTRLRFKTVGPLQFYDVWGVKIFEKEIRGGRL